MAFHCLSYFLTQGSSWSVFLIFELHMLIAWFMECCLYFYWLFYAWLVVVRYVLFGKTIAGWNVLEAKHSAKAFFVWKRQNSISAAQERIPRFFPSSKMSKRNRKKNVMRENILLCFSSLLIFWCLKGFHIQMYRKESRPWRDNLCRRKLEKLISGRQ